MSQSRSGLLKAGQIKNKMLEIGFWNLAGRALGLVKDIVLARFLGFGATADAFMLAFRVPNLLRTTFAEGSIPAAMVPVCSKLVKEREFERTRGLLFLASVAVTVIGSAMWAGVWLWPDQIIGAMAVGLEPERLAMTAKYLKIVFPFLTIVALCCVFSSALHAKNSFAVPAAGTAVFNLAWMGLLVLGIYFGLPALYVGVAVLLAGLVKLLVRLFVLGYKGLWPSPVSAGASWPDFVLVSQRFLPLAMGVSFALVDVLAEMQVSSFLPMGQIALTHYAFKAFNLPFFAIHTGIGNVIFAQVSKLGSQNLSRMRFYLFHALRLTLSVCLPVGVFMVAYSKGIAKFVLAGRASPDQVLLVSKLLCLLAVGLLLNIVSRIVSNFFYALGDTRTPTAVWGAAVAVSATGGLASVLVFDLSVVWVLGATVFSWGLAATTKLVLLARWHNVSIDAGRTMAALRELSVQSLGMCVLSVCLARWAERLLLKSVLGMAGVFKLFVSMGFGIILFFGLNALSRKLARGRPGVSYFFD